MISTEAVRKAAGTDWQAQTELILQARVDFQRIREAAHEGDAHEVLAEIMAAGEDAFIEAQLARWDGAIVAPPKATTGVPLNIRALGEERTVLLLL
jgi:hypothetical protein